VIAVFVVNGNMAKTRGHTINQQQLLSSTIPVDLTQQKTAGTIK
jgi:uncharacterized protein YycO